MILTDGKNTWMDESVKLSPIKDLELLLEKYREGEVIANRSEIQRALQIQLHDLGELPSKRKETLMAIAAIAIMGVELELQNERKLDVERTTGEVSKGPRR